MILPTGSFFKYSEHKVMFTCLQAMILHNININLIKFGLLAGYLCLPAGRLSLYAYRQAIFVCLQAGYLCYDIRAFLWSDMCLQELFKRQTPYV